MIFCANLSWPPSSRDESLASFGSETKQRWISESRNATRTETDVFRSRSRRPWDRRDESVGRASVSTAPTFQGFRRRQNLWKTCVHRQFTSDDRVRFLRLRWLILRCRLTRCRRLLRCLASVDTFDRNRICRCRLLRLLRSLEGRRPSTWATSRRSAVFSSLTRFSSLSKVSRTIWFDVTVLNPGFRLTSGRGCGTKLEVDCRTKIRQRFQNPLLSSIPDRCWAAGNVKVDTFRARTFRARRANRREAQVRRRRHLKCRWRLCFTERRLPVCVSPVLLLRRPSPFSVTRVTSLKRRQTPIRPMTLKRLWSVNLCRPFLPTKIVKIIWKNLLAWIFILTQMILGNLPAYTTS